MDKKPKQKKIMIADDDHNICETLKKFIEAAGDYEVLIANSGNETLKMARKEKPDLMFLDLMMPDKSGFDVLKELKGSRYTQYIPVIVLTGRTDEEALHDTMYLYAEQHLTKPVSHTDIQAAIDRVLSDEKNEDKS